MNFMFGALNPEASELLQYKVVSSLKNDLPSETFNNAYMVFGQMLDADCMSLIHQLTAVEAANDQAQAKNMQS